MRYTQLRSFHAVARAGSMTAASRDLRLSQPTLTAQVRALERDFDIELFVRAGRRLRLTDAGRGLYAITQRFLDQEKEAVEFLNQTRELTTGHLRLGAVGPYHATDMLVAFNARHPGIYVSVKIGNSREVVTGLMEYETDVAVLAHIDPNPRLVAIPYSRHPVVVMAYRGHRLFGRRAIRLELIEGERLIHREQGSTTRRAFEAALVERGVKPRVVMEIGSREAIREAVAGGIGLGVVSEAEFIPDPRICAIRVSNADIFTYAHIAYLSERREARMIRAFVASAEALRRGR
ncbi:MAG: LysR substrate-binding domain-containing protein [Alphaproteobacteria bacterium]|nr:LysR substrate-binding domain-containing protein [Alphaproteobacteria bacterium]